MSDVLALEGVSKRYGTQVAVDSLDLTLRVGEFLTLLGPSGSGKTTTLMMVAGLQQPDNGTIRLNGASVADLPPYHRDPFDRLLVAQAMAEPAALSTVDKALARYSHLVRII